MSSVLSEKSSSKIDKERHRVRMPLETLEDYFAGDAICPYFIHGNAFDVLQTFPAESIDCCITSPPYWGKRQYDAVGIGLEDDYRDYVRSLCDIFYELRRVLKDTGSVWLNL